MNESDELKQRVKEFFEQYLNRREESDLDVELREIAP